MKNKTIDLVQLKRNERDKAFDEIQDNAIISTAKKISKEICDCRGNGNANYPDLPCTNCGGINPMRKKKRWQSIYFIQNLIYIKTGKQ